MPSPSTPSPAAHHFARLCQRSGRGTGGHLVRFWAMLSTPHRHTSPPIDQQQGSASTVCHPPRLVLVLVLFLHVVMVGHSKRANEKKRERTRAKDAAAIFASSSPLFCSVCCLHRPHHRQPLTPHYVAPSPKGMAATPSASGRCHRHTSPATRRAATRAVGHPPRLVLVLASLPLFQVVRVGQRASQGGRSPSAHPADPLHPAGEDRHRPASHFWRFGEHIPQTRTN